MPQKKPTEMAILNPEQLSETIYDLTQQIDESRMRCDQLATELAMSNV